MKTLAALMIALASWSAARADSAPLYRSGPFNDPCKWRLIDTDPGVVIYSDISQLGCEKQKQNLPGAKGKVRAAAASVMIDL